MNATEPMNTRYTALSTEQKLALTSEQLDKAIQLEAAERGIPIPMEFGDAINQLGYVGYTIPADSVSFYEIVTPGYSGGRTTICFKTEEAALKALEGAIIIREEGYDKTRRNKLQEGEPTVQKIFLTHSRSQSFIQGVKQYEEDRVPYQDLCEELQENLQSLRQAKYNADILAAKRKKYLDLANGDDATAERFWNNLERGEWKKTEPEASGELASIEF